MDDTLATIRTNLFEAAILVMIVLFLFLRNVRAALLTAAVIPLAMLMTVSGMVRTGVSANLMSLGALDFGLIVDGAVIIVENCMRRLGMASAGDGSGGAVADRLRRPPGSHPAGAVRCVHHHRCLSADLLPFRGGRENVPSHGDYRGDGTARRHGAVGDLRPGAVALLFRGAVGESANPVVDGLKRGYRPLLLLTLRFRYAVLVVALLLVAMSLWQASRLGTEFIPNLDEGDITMHALRIPGTSLGQAIEMQTGLEEIVAELPQVERVFSRIGSGEIATDPMSPAMADTFIMLKPRSEWPDPDQSKEALIAELAALVEVVPGNQYEYLQPIEMRFNELLAGVRAQLAIKLFGDDFEVLNRAGEAVEAAVAALPGAADVAMEQTTGLPVLTLIPDRTALARHGVSLAELQDLLSTGLGGEVIGQLYEGDRRADIVLRLADQLRTDPDGWLALPVPLPGGGYVPLAELARLEVREGLNQVNRENGKRRVVVTANVRGRDLGTFVADVQQAVTGLNVMPPGYWIEYGGTYRNLQSATARLMVVIPVTLLFIWRRWWLRSAPFVMRA